MMKKQKRYDADLRTSEDIKDQIEELSKSYVPEWHFDRVNPDIGSVIAIMFADQFADNIKRYNELVEVYHADLVNMMGVSLMPAQPAGTSVVMRLTQDTVEGSYIPMGTKLLGMSDEGSFIFETTHPLFVTNSNLREIFETSEQDGKIIPRFGSLVQKPIFPEEAEYRHFISSAEAEGTGTLDNLEAFKLFDFENEGIERNAILLYHSNSFDVKDEKIFVRFTGGEKLLAMILRNEMKVSYLSESGIIDINDITVSGDVLIIKKEEDCRKVTREKEYSLLIFEATTPVRENIEVLDIGFSSVGEPASLTAAGNGNTDYDVENFKPFGETLSLFQECFLYHDEYFSRAGARITLTFAMEFGTHVMTFGQQEYDDSLKIIKRKPRVVFAENPVDSFAEQISIEYLSPNGWRRLALVDDATGLFADAKSRKVTMSFICPDDWEENSGNGRCIRIQTLKCDNCYMMPCAHHYPVIKDFKVSYSYEGRYKKPERLEVVSGSETRIATRELLEGKGVTVLAKSKYTDNAIYFGFGRKFANGPVSMLFVFEDDIAFVGEKLRFEYSTNDGFKPLHVVDKTETFARTGQIRFIPPENMAAVTIEDKKLYWIRVVDADKVFSNSRVYRPIIKKVYLNAVDVINVDTVNDIDYGVDEIAPDLNISLPGHNILDIDLFVNEKGQHKEASMRELLRNDPANYKAEYDFRGNIVNFFVKWTEVPNFQASNPGDRHYILDREMGRVFFGDGVHVEIPRVVGPDSIRITKRSCDGVNGNLPVDSINESMSSLDFIGEIGNPFPSFGGGNMETVENAMSRAAGILSNKNRLVTKEDYIGEVITSSDSIDKVDCIVGESVDGTTRDGLISIVLLMKDYGKGTHSFDKLLPRLRERLEERVELTAISNIEIVEPIGVMISVDIWLNKMEEDNDYEVHQMLTEALTEYLSPVSNEEHRGWDIGKLPTRTQIMMKLSSLKTGAFIRRLVITGTYTDTSGVHECDLENLPDNSFFVCRSGKHKAHIINDSIK